MAIFDPAERRLAETVARLAYCNPFLPERIELERRALGDAFEPRWINPGGLVNRLLVARTRKTDYEIACIAEAARLAAAASSVWGATRSWSRAATAGSIVASCAWETTPADARPRPSAVPCAPQPKQ